MATQQAVKSAPNGLPAPRKGGRPPGSRNKTAEEKRLAGTFKGFDYTRCKNVFQKPADFYSYIAGYPDKTGILAAVYRIKPRIDLSLIGNDETAILKTTVESEMTEEHVGLIFGRGVYMLCVTDANRPRGQTEIAKTWFDCASAEKPPQYDPRTLLIGDPKNVDEVNRLLNQGIFVRDAATGSPRLRTTADGPPVPPPSAAPAAGAAANPFGQFDLSSVIVGLINQGSRNPHETVKDTIEVAKLLAPAAAPGPDLDAIVERVVVRLGLQANGVRPEDPFTAYERIHGLLSRFSGGAVAPAAEGPNSAPPPPSGNLAVAAHLPAILSEVRMLIPEVGQMLRDLRAGRDAAPKAEQDMQSSRQQQQQPQTLEQRIEHIIRLGFQKMGEGVKGFDFAAYVCGFHPGGLEVYRFLEPQGAAGLIALAAMNPAARRLVNDPQIRPQLETFLLDFFTFDPSPASDGLSEADDPPAA